MESYTNSSNKYASAAEMRLTQEKADVPVLDKEALEVKITEAKALEKEGYTTSSVNALNEAIAKAEKVLAEAKEQSEIDLMVEKLTEAMKLEKKADAKESKAEYDKLIADVKEESVYTEVTCRLKRCSWRIKRERNRRTTAARETGKSGNPTTETAKATAETR